MGIDLSKVRSHSSGSSRTTMDATSSDYDSGCLSIIIQLMFTWL